jgi:hypothetical protein
MHIPQELMNLIGDFANGTSEYWKTQNEMCLKELSLLSDEFEDDTSKREESFVNYAQRWMGLVEESYCCPKCQKELSPYEQTYDMCMTCEDELQANDF